MTLLGPHLRHRVRYLESRIRSGLALRHERPWTGLDDDIARRWRLRLHKGIRYGVHKLRTARQHLAEYRALRAQKGR